MLAPTTGDSALDAVARALGFLAQQGVAATGIVMNSADWLSVMLSKNTTEDYLLGSPAQATATTVWGTPIALTPKIAVGTILVGNFRLGAELAYRESAQIDISTEDRDNFIRNLITIRGEESVALAIKQPACFVRTTLPAPVGTAQASVSPSKK